MRLLKTLFPFDTLLSKKKYLLFEVLIPIRWCEFIPALQNMKYKKACLTLAQGVQETQQISNLPLKAKMWQLKTNFTEKKLTLC